MSFRSGDEMVQIEATIEHSTAKAWLINDLMSGKQVWLPKSVGTMLEEPDPSTGNVIFNCQEWWCKKNGLI